MTTSASIGSTVSGPALPRSTPEAQGIPSSAIRDFIRTADQQVEHMHSFMLVRHGHVIAEAWWHPYTWSEPHLLFSLTKSFMSTAVGMAIDEGRFSLDDPVLKFFPNERPANPPANLEKLTIRHLLTMGTGHTADPTGMVRSGENNWVKAFFDNPPQQEPGGPFLYNSAASHVAGVIVQVVTGQTLLEYLTPRLFEPLGIHPPYWEKCPMGFNTGGWGMKARTEDIAKFGQFYLNRGRWNGRQLISPEWVKLATSAQIDNSMRTEPDWKVGYGFQFWRCRHNAYRGDGAFGQYCVVMPDQDAVVAITSGVRNMQQVLDLVWEHLLRAMKDSALPSDPSAQSQLLQTIGKLALPTIPGGISSAVESQVAGRKFRFSENPLQMESVSLSWGNAQCRMQIERGGSSATITADFAKWATQIHDGEPVAACYAWTEPNTCKILIWHTDTPFSRTYTFRFSDQGVSLSVQQNVAFGPTTFGPFESSAG